ncbi:MAG: hypothetical protein ACE14S_10110 [Candidatus Bathyarchaeia archaeon]
MKTRTRDASGQILFSWLSEQAISHFRHPLHLEKSLAIQTRLLSSANLHAFLKPTWGVTEYRIESLFNLSANRSIFQHSASCCHGATAT